MVADLGPGDEEDRRATATPAGKGGLCGPGQAPDDEIGTHSGPYTQTETALVLDVSGARADNRETGRERGSIAVRARIPRKRRREESDGHQREPSGRAQEPTDGRAEGERLRPGR